MEAFLSRSDKSRALKNRVRMLLRAPSPLIRNAVRRNPEQPNRKGNPSPFESGQIRQRMLKDFGSQIFSVVPVMYTANNERIDTLKVRLVQFREVTWILLSGF